MAREDDRESDLVTVEQRRVELPAAAPDTFVLVVVEGPDAGRTFPLEGLRHSRVRVGKSEGCDVRLNDRAVSRRHAALDLVNGRLRVTDLGSTNGTSVDGVSVLDGHVADGQVVRIGATAFRLERRASDLTPAVGPSSATGFGRLLGSSPAMRRLYPVCERLASLNVPVVIEGETGTGKEVLAESLHERGPRAAGPFVVLDCTTVSPNLLEAELFGHERGAYTGAVGTRKGVFEQANGGTLLIDEIGDLDLALQPKLLRAIERSEVRRIGGSQTVKVDVRLLAATRRDLDREVQAGRFRDDLYHRLWVAPLELPPLRERVGDVELLARHFFREMGAPGAVPVGELMARWRDYNWPGNVRELRNTVARQIALGDLGTYGEEDDAAPASSSAGTSDYIDEVLALRLPLTLARERVVDNFERRYVARVLAEHDGNVMRAAHASGIARRYLQKLKARQGK